MRRGGYLGLSGVGWGQCHYKGPYLGGCRVRVKEAEVGEMFFEDRGRGHKPRITGSFQKLEEAKEQILP